jgi:dTDP-4-dehydrorhamnose 3,5-epimerase
MMTNFHEISTELSGIWLYEPTNHVDERGSTTELLNVNHLPEEISDCKVTQLLTSSSVKNTIRGVHYAASSNAQVKILTCTYGEIMDIVVDLRPHSLTFGKYEVIQLTASSSRVLMLSPGFGHAYEVISDSATMMYAIETQFRFDLEFSINPLDEDLSLPWNTSTPVISKKDLNGKTFNAAINELKVIS